MDTAIIGSSTGTTFTLRHNFRPKRTYTVQDTFIKRMIINNHNTMNWVRQKGKRKGERGGEEEKEGGREEGRERGREGKRDQEIKR